MLIGEFLEEKMKAKHMTKAELSRLSGVPATTIGSMISRNNTRVAIETLLKICEVLECDINEYIATIRSANAKPLTETQARLAELAEAGDPSPQVRMLMGLPERAAPDGMKNAPAVIQNGSDLAKRLEALSDEELRKFMKFVDLMTSEDQHDKDEMEMFMEFIVYRKKQKTAPKGGQK